MSNNPYAFACFCATSCGAPSSDPEGLGADHSDNIAHHTSHSPTPTYRPVCRITHTRSLVFAQPRVGLRARTRRVLARTILIILLIIPVIHPLPRIAQYVE